MHPDVERILHHECDTPNADERRRIHAELPERVRALADETMLWELMSAYNWDDGFAVPLAVVRHPRCDRALALRMFWELDDAARIHHADEQHALREQYATEAAHSPQEFEHLLAYCTTLVERLRDGSFPLGANSCDTGFFGLDDPALGPHADEGSGASPGPDLGLELTPSARRLRVARTRAARREYEDAFLLPVVGTAETPTAN
ncbi:DUF4274 domain-containing protein [Streptomyces sp. XM4193]|uniref:DUF4274 domain-containing protein n=1 Tax=Streptomyces sp. XM4193 TaxID=2929782 RepID=UPI001FF7714E|nr:DUF4274 domain-containing protein [Streptomyces sp. XM4193]MCK1797462.1 DUF4274 domain-containing protein [Streptomyces sp. XM4193]